MNEKRDDGLSLPFAKTLAFRIFLSFLIFSAILTIGFGSTVFYRLNQGFKEIQSFRMDQEVKKHMEALAKGEIPQLSRSSFFTAYDNIEKIPEPIRKVVRNLPDGLYDAQGPAGVGGPKWHAYQIRTLPEGKGRLYFIFTLDDFNLRREIDQELENTFYYGFIVAALLGVIGAYLTSRMLTKPTKRLAFMIQSSSPEALPVGFSSSFPTSEIGLLARALDANNQRVAAFIEREKQFTRDASHELRTPVTVIKGAMELIAKMPDEQSDPVKRPLSRVARSLKEMEYLVETLLKRSREKAETAPDFFNAASVVQEIVADSQYLIERKEVRLSFKCTSTPSLDVSLSDFKMAASNLIRNACNYTRKGEVRVSLTLTALEIKDTGPGISPEILNRLTEPFVKGEASMGYGLGLAIVKRICDDSGWTLSIENTSPGTRIRISFS